MLPLVAGRQKAQAARLASRAWDVERFDITCKPKGRRPLELATGTGGATSCESTSAATPDSTAATAVTAVLVAIVASASVASVLTFTFPLTVATVDVAVAIVAADRPQSPLRLHLENR